MKKRKRKRCFICRHAEVIRYGRGDNRFPMGVFCELDDIPFGDDPRDYVRTTDDICVQWQEKGAQ